NSAYRAGVSLSGIGLSTANRHQGEDSIGAAARIAGEVSRGGVVHDRAAAAFTNAFNLASAVSVGIVLVLAAVLFWSSRPQGDEPVGEFDVLAGGVEPEFALVPSGAGERTE